MEDGITVLRDFDPVLYEQADPPLVSLYLPTHGRSPVSREDRASFQALVDEVRAKLAQEYERREYGPLAKRLGVLAERFDHVVSPAPEGGLAVFVGNEAAYVYNLGYSVERRAVVGDRFYLKPLMRNFLFGAHYFLLGLNADRFSFIHGDFGSLERVELPRAVHDEFSELFPQVYDGREAALDYRSLENHMPPYHGHKSRNDVKKEEAGKFFRHVDKAVSEHLVRGTRLPVILVSLPEHQAAFRRIATIPNLLDEGIEKNVDGVEFPELLADATAVIERARARRDSAVADEYGAARAAGTATDDAEAIASALVERRVRALLVQEQAVVPGVYDAETGTLTRPADGDGEAGDLVDAFAQATLAQGGEVYLLQAAILPTHAGVAALLRY